MKRGGRIESPRARRRGRGRCARTGGRRGRGGGGGRARPPPPWTATAAASPRPRGRRRCPSTPATPGPAASASASPAIAGTPWRPPQRRARRLRPCAARSKPSRWGCRGFRALLDSAKGWRICFVEARFWLWKGKGEVGQDMRPEV
jgi:hypothetical protein